MLETTVLEVELDADVQNVVKKGHVSPVAKTPAPEHAPTSSTRIHAGVAWSFLGINLVMFAILLATFASDRETIFMIAICGFYFAMYLGTPYVMMRVKGDRLQDRSTWTAFLDRPFQTWTGSISGREAWMQICLVPLAVTITLTGICFIIIAARP